MSWCRACEYARLQEWKVNNPDKWRQQRARKQARRKERNREYIREYKESRPCTDCGLNWPYYVLDFDHARGLKIDNISKLLSRPLNFLKREIEKCDLLCSNCHRIRTHQRETKKEIA